MRFNRGNEVIVGFPPAGPPSPGHCLSVPPAYGLAVALDGLVHHDRTNAVVGWLFAGVVALGAGWSFLDGAVLWGGFAAFVAAVMALPALSTRDPMAMVPWPLPGVAALAVAVGASGSFLEVAGYVGVAAVAVVVVVELDVFTSVELSRRFAVAFAVLTTMALQALWTVAQFYSDRWLSTTFIRSQTDLQWDFVAVTLVGFAMGGFFQWYLARFETADSGRRPAERVESS